MIRRGFWLTTGAVSGIVAYRRVSAVGRRVSASLNLRTSANVRTGGGAGTGVGQPGPLISVQRTRRATIRAARETYRFTRDVREGMALYMARQSAPGSTLGTDQDAYPVSREPARIAAARIAAARHDDEKDGH